METDTNTRDKLLALLLKEPFATHTATSLAKALNLTRQGVWKSLNKLLDEELINFVQVSNTKTGTNLITLNWSNPLTEKTLSLLLTKEALAQKRWRADFAELKDNISFLILFGSILTNSKEANDIDLLAVVKKEKFKELNKSVQKIQKTQIKKIHLIDLTDSEFTKELKSGNNAYKDALRKGVILYGQDSFVNFIMSLKNG